MKCPVCSEVKSTSFFEIGNMPVSIGVQYPSRRQATACAKGRLDLIFCSACGFIWNRSFDAGLLEYSQRYDNSLDHSPVFREFARGLARRLIHTYGITQKRVLEIGCGKGHFLSLLCEEGGNSGIGFDPSYEGDQIRYSGRGSIEYHKDFYGEKHVSSQGDMVCCRHVFEHVENPVDFLSTVYRTINGDRDVMVYFEVPNVRFILDQLSVWDVIYEHCNYFGCESLEFVFKQAGFEVIRLEEAYGGQFLSIEARISKEDWDGRSEATYNVGTSALAESVNAFPLHVAAREKRWIERLALWSRDNTRTVIWGGGAKTVSFLNMLPLGGIISYVVDINPNKQGLYIPGSGQEIIAPEFLMDYQPDIVILMNPIYHREVEFQLEEMKVKAMVVDA
jgi:SAM-dependent methyltransferase